MNDHTYFARQNLLPSRLDKILTELSGFSRSKIQKMIRDGCIVIDSTPFLDPSCKISTECEIKITNYKPQTSAHITEKEMELDIIYEDDHLMVINKPAGLTVHPGAGNYNDTLINGLLHYGKNLSKINGNERPGIVHRLDRDTTGLMMVAKSDIAHNNLAMQIKNREAKRSYLTLCWGMLKKSSGVINANIGRDRRDRTKKAVLEIGGKNAITHYKVFEILAGGLFSLVECGLETGRTHQIRVHMEHIGHSIVGDQTYGSNNKKAKQIKDEEMRERIISLRRQSLHAYKLLFMHPITNETMKFELPLPDDINNLIEWLRYLNSKLI